MDSITKLIKDEIKAQYKNLAKFAEASGIPYSTLSNALAKGVGGTSYDTVVKICKMLGIQQSYDSDIVLFNREFHDFYTKLTQLDRQGIHTVCAILNAEYFRCTQDSEDPTVKGYNGIGYAIKAPTAADEESIRRLVKRVQKHE